MPKYRIELSDGRKFDVEADAPPSEADVLKQLGLEESTSEPPAFQGPRTTTEGYFENVKGERLLQSDITKGGQNTQRLVRETDWTWHPPAGASGEHGGAVGSAIATGVPVVGSVTPEGLMTGGQVARGVVGGAMAATPGIVSRVIAGASALSANPIARYELVRGGLQRLGVPYEIAFPLALAASGGRGGKKGPATPARPEPATVPPTTGPAAASRTGFAAPVPGNAVTPAVIAAPAPAPVAVPPEARVSGTGFTGPASLADTAALGTRFTAPSTGTASPWSMPAPAARPGPPPMSGPVPRLVPQGTALPSTPASVPPLQSTIQQAVEQARAAPPLMSPVPPSAAAPVPAAVAPAAAVPVPASPASGPAATWSPKLLQEAVEKAASRVQAQLTEAQITQASQLIREGHPPVSAVQRVLTMTDVQRLSAQVGSEKAAKILGTTKENIKELRGASISALPERARAAIDARLATLKEPAAIQAYLDAAPNEVTKAYIKAKLGRQ